MTTKRTGRWSVALAAVVHVGMPGGASAQQRVIPLDGPGWEYDGDIHVEQYDGRTVLSARTGAALLPDIGFQDGEITFDMMVRDVRSFVYITFRQQGSGDHEEIYFRPHKSGLPDAVQYAPVFRGAAGWQLYHDEAATAALRIPPGTWIPVRLVVSGGYGTLYVGESSEPVLALRLQGRIGAGGIGLESFAPGLPDTEPVVARFANLRVAPGESAGLVRAERKAALPGIVGLWDISPALEPAANRGVPEPPAVADGDWTRVRAEPSGLVNLDRHVRRSGEGKRVAARLVLRSPTARTVAFDIGFSDDAVAFLNGRPIWSATAQYSFDHPRRDGLIGLDTRLYLPLEAGDNELLVVVSDDFGGWGIMGRLDPESGVSTSD